MLLTPTDDQEFFRETTARFLDEFSTPGEVRRLRDHEHGFEADYWRRGAELGWTTLLVSEANGGGSISGAGLVDLTLVAHEFGRRAAPGPLIPTNVVAAALNDTNSHPDVLTTLVAGTSVAAWCHAEPRPNDRLGRVTLDMRIDGDHLVVNGSKRPVDAAGAAQHLLVTGRTGDGYTQVLIPADTPGITITPLRTLDPTRRCATVTFTDVRVPLTALVGEVGGAAAQIDRQLLIAASLANSEAVGAMQTAFDITLEWTGDRYSFGRPLASYQALKHRMADMKSWLESSHAIADDAAAALANGAANAPMLVSAAKAYIGDYGTELIQDCVQLHGGIGVSYEHDIHLYLRRHTMNRSMYGTPPEHRRRIADMAIANPSLQNEERNGH